MRLLLVSHSANDPNGGASRVYHFLADGLRKRGHEVQCLHLDDIAIPGAIQKLATRCLLPSFVSRTAARVIRQSSIPFDVLFSSNGMLSPLYKRLKSEPKRPLLVNHIHGLNYFDHQATMSEVERGHGRVSATYRYCTGPLPVRWDVEGARHSDLSIVQNKRDEDFLLEKGFRCVERIPLAVHPAILEAGVSAPKQSDRNPASLLWFGSWTARKGMYYLPQAFERVSERFPETRLTIGGTAMTQQEIAAYFKESLRARTRVLPSISVEQQIAEMEGNAIFLFPSLSEGFGFAALEALAMGMALVTTPTGFGGDLLVDRQHARIVSAASASYLADAAIELIERPELRGHLAEHGRRLAETLALERMVSSYEQAFEDALKRRAQIAAHAASVHQDWK
ncbi:MAG: glycosyltransferase family 4 protein [Terracidiphilus sp.]|jgi:glycosyltransferase involved in cell wall biosynthesis